jgi:hypothetical protein
MFIAFLNPYKSKLGLHCLSILSYYSFLTLGFMISYCCYTFKIVKLGLQSVSDHGVMNVKRYFINCFM